MRDILPCCFGGAGEVIGILRAVLLHAAQGGDPDGLEAAEGKGALADHFDLWSADKPIIIKDRRGHGVNNPGGTAFQQCLGKTLGVGESETALKDPVNKAFSHRGKAGPPGREDEAKVLAPGNNFLGLLEIRFQAFYFRRIGQGIEVQVADGDGLDHGPAFCGDAGVGLGQGVAQTPLSGMTVNQGNFQTVLGSSTMDFNFEVVD